MNHAVRKSLVALGLVGASLASMGAAHAGGVSWHIGINLPGPVFPGPAVIYEPPVVYAPPPRVVYAPPPRVVYGPAPIVYEPAPVYAPRGRGYWRDGRWCDDDRGDRGDRGDRWHHNHRGDRDDRRGEWDDRRYRY